MNGRLYDPLLRRFLNADENIQDPHNTQNYNKYGYVMNNPLMYSDPNGEFFVFLGLGVLFWKAVIIGAVVGLASYTLGLAVTGNLNQWNLGGALKSMFWGAVSGAVTFGIGSVFSSSSGTLTAIGKALGDARVLVQGAAHALSQGTLSLMQGGNFWSGAAAGFLGHLGAEAWGTSMKGLGLENFAKNTGGQILFGALSGGIGAELSGGNFWQGAVTGGIVAGLNSAMHKMDLSPKPKERSNYEKLKSTLDGLGLNNSTKEAILEFVKNPDDLGKVGLKFKNILGVAGKVLGVASIGLAINDYLQNPSTAGLVKIVSSITALGISTVASGGIATAATGWILSLGDATGASDYIYGKIGNFIDTQFYGGKSLGNEVYKSINATLKPLISNYNFAK